MRGLVAWFAANPVAANLLMAFLLLAGLVAASSVRQEVFPNVAFDSVAVTVVYPGAAPDEVEESVCTRIEEAIEGVQGIDRVFGRASEGYGAVWAKLAIGADPRRVLDEIRSRVDALDTLPDDAETPVVRELVDDSVLIGLVVYGDVGEERLRGLGERIRDDVTALPEVTRAELVGVRDREIAIEVSEAALYRHGLDFDRVAAAVRASSVELPGGALKTHSGDILVRARGRAHRGEEFGGLVLLTRPDGSRVRLGDVAQVTDGFEESDERVRFDGEPAVVVRLLASERGRVLDVVGAVRRYVREAAVRLPPGVRLAVWADRSLEFQSRRDLLLRNGLQGLLLILAILALFLRLRLAGWVSLGIPVAFLGAFVAMGATGVSLNMMSMFAFIAALGLVVDDAIIIGENVARHHVAGADPLHGAIEGANEVAVPVVMSVLTTMLFVAPSLALPTFMGKMAFPLAVVVIACLFFSLVESLLILPAHLARRPGPPRVRGRLGARLERMQGAAARGLEDFVARRYRPMLDAALRWPLGVLACGIALFALSIGALVGGWVPFSFLPYIEVDRVSARLVLPDGAPREATRAARARLEAEAHRLGAELAAREGVPVFRHLLTAVGDRPDRHDDYAAGGDGPNVVNVSIDLVPGERRSVTSFEVKERWRERVGKMPGARSLVFIGSEFGFDRRIDVSISGSDPAELDRAAAEVERALAVMPGVREIANSQGGGKQEIALRVRPEAEALGLSLGELARQVRQGFHGEEVQRIQRGRDDVAVVLRYPRAERSSAADLDAVRIRLPGGGEVPFSAVAEPSVRTGYSSIERRDRRRNVSVTADVDFAITEPDVVLTELAEHVFPRLERELPSVHFDIDGISRDESEMMARLVQGALLALLVAYALLAIPLRSYAQPLVILVAIPFGFVGAVAGHAALGLQFSAFSTVGLIALTGVVVNDALLLIHRANGQRALGAPLREALVEAAATRFRPILLTSLTTFVGLAPLLFESSAQALWLKPMAVALSFGVAFATVVTLLLVPACYVLLEDAGAGLVAARRRLRGALGATPEASPR